MIDHEEAKQQQHDNLIELMKQIKSIELKLDEAKRQERDWSRIATQYTNELNNIKKEARDISDKLFGEPKIKGQPVQDWSPCG